MRYRNPDLLGPLSSFTTTKTLSAPHKHTTNPVVTGTSVVAIKYKDGVMMAADTLGSYGTLARFMQFERIKSFGDVLVGGSGDLSDLQYIFDELTSLRTREFTHDDGHSLTAKEMWAYLTRVLYSRRNNNDPLYVQLIIADSTFLAQVDLHGTCFEDETLATGFGAHLARPILRNAARDGHATDLSQAQARSTLEECMRVLFYRDCKTINRIQFAEITSQGATVSAPVELSTAWDIGNRPSDPRGSW
jgi:20S proteasome subunit beta 7